MRKFIATTAAGLALATGSIAVATLTPIGTAFAQDSAPQAQTQTKDGEQGRGEHGNRHIRRQVARAAVKDAAGVIGIDAKDLVAEIRGGKSIAEVATEHGVDPQTVIDKLVADANARIDQAVAEGKVPQERADKVKAALPERVTQLVNRHFDGSRLPAGPEAAPAS